MPEGRLAKQIGTLLRQRGWTLALAESCTGGLLGHYVTNIPGSSAYFLGGVVAYANAVKVNVLGVDLHSLQQDGAVSEAVARQLARGVRRLLGADLGVAITGIAGPSGATDEKPLGLTYLALATETCERCERHVWPHDRRGNKKAAAQRALEMVLLLLQEES
jgi:PncC family amidohydrolase